MQHTMTEDADLLRRIKEAAETLKRTTVEVGLPDSASSRNKFLLALHERGSPVMRIPPRPVVGPALSSPAARAAVTEGLMAACEAASEGDSDGVISGFEAAGDAGVDAIHAYIDAGISPPNAPVTVQGGWVWNRVAGTGVKVEGKGFNKPLVETGELYGAFGKTVKS